MKTILTLFLSLFVSALAFAIPESEVGTGTYARSVGAYFSAGVAGSFKGVDGLHIRYRTFEVSDEKGAVVFVNGKGESFAKWAELIYDFGHAGYSVYALDHRGQGFSDRILKNPRKVYVEHFDDYVSDLKTFVNLVVNSKPHSRRFLLSHSMGGAIAALYLEQNQNDFDAAVFSAPMLEINTSPYPNWLARGLAEAGCSVGLGQSYAPGQGDKNSDNTFAKQRLTHSETRFRKMGELGREFRGINVGGLTYRWVEQALHATGRAVNNAASIKTPLLLFQAGADALVKPKKQDEFCAKVEQCHKIFYPEAFHSLLHERDSIRDDFVNQSLDFFDRHR